MPLEFKQLTFYKQLSFNWNIRHNRQKWDTANQKVMEAAKLKGLPSI
jgi:hypothetical protein